MTLLSKITFEIIKDICTEYKTNQTVIKSHDQTKFNPSHFDNNLDINLANDSIVVKDIVRKYLNL